MKLPSIRKGCVHCGTPLKSFGERVLRTCKVCASSSREGFALMGEGKFKEGINKVLDVKAGLNTNPEERKKAEFVIESTMKNAITNKETKIRQKLKKKGLSEEEIEEALKTYKKELGLK